MGEPPFPSCNCTMAALARSYQKFLRVAPQAPAIARQMSGGHGGGYETWKKAFIFAAIPIIILGHVNAFGMADESAHAAPEFVPYDHLRIRSKKFPWGDGNHSLIHNSHMNALPDVTSTASIKLFNLNLILSCSFYPCGVCSPWFLAPFYSEAAAVSTEAIGTRSVIAVTSRNILPELIRS